MSPLKVNNHIKYHYIFKRSFTNYEELSNNLGSFVTDYNSRLKLSPNDVADGKTFDIDKYKENLKAARIYHTEIRSVYINSKYFFVL